MKITRREFCQASAPVTLAAALLGTSAFTGFDSVAVAQKASDAELLKPSPLGEMVLGDAKAPVTIIEYASTTCSHCAHFATTTMPELKKRYIDTGKVRYMLREFPTQPAVLSASGFMLARCVAKEDAEKYYAMIDILFRLQDTWVVQQPFPPLQKISRQAGLSDKEFTDCLANQSLIEKIQEVQKTAIQKLGVKSTPTFFVNGEMIVGDVSIDEMAKKIDPYLKAG